MSDNYVQPIRRMLEAITKFQMGTFSDRTGHPRTDYDVTISHVGSIICYKVQNKTKRPGSVSEEIRNIGCTLDKSIKCPNSQDDKEGRYLPYTGNVSAWYEEFDAGSEGYKKTLAGERLRPAYLGGDCFVRYFVDNEKTYEALRNKYLQLARERAREIIRSVPLKANAIVPPKDQWESAGDYRYNQAVGSALRSGLSLDVINRIKSMFAPISREKEGLLEAFNELSRTVGSPG